MTALAAWLAAFGTTIIALPAETTGLALSERVLFAHAAGLVAAALYHSIESTRAQRASWHARRAEALSR